MGAAAIGVPPSIGPSVRPPFRLLVAVAIMVATGLILALFGASPSTGDTSGALPSGAPLSAQTCSTLESPNDLNSSLAGLYNGFSLQGYQAGSNATPALGITSYPNLTAGQAALDSDWTSICESGQFGYAYTQAGETAGFSSGGELAGDGHYVFFYGFGWQDACPTKDSGSPYTCGASATWTVDLVTDSFVGPSFTNIEQVPLGAP